MIELHKNDPGTYTVTKFDKIGRKIGSELCSGVIDGQSIADAWAEESGGSAVVHRCIYNTAIKRESWG